MTTNEKFAVLQAIGLTKAEADAYFAHIGEAVSPAGKWQRGKIDTPCPIAYRRKTGEIEVLPYLDFSCTSEVWGIKCGNLIFKKIHDREGTWDDAMGYIAKQQPQISNRKLCIASEPQYAALRKDIQNFNLTAALLRRNAVFAEEWGDNSYWAASNLENQTLHVQYHMGKGRATISNKFDNFACIRLALKE